MHGLLIHWKGTQKTEPAMVQLERGGDMLALGACGLTPLHVAAKNGRAETFRLLVKMGGDALAKDNDGNTALHFAAYDGHVETVKMLVGEFGNSVLAARRYILLLVTCTQKQ
jgi:ankyrin repeat protein